MDVYAGDGAYLGSVRRVRLGPRWVAAGALEIEAIEVGSWWRPTGRLRIPVDRIQTVSMERVVLTLDVRDR